MWKILALLFFLLAFMLSISTLHAELNPIISNVTPEGWVVINGVTNTQMAALCPDKFQDRVTGCAVWKGPLFLARPAKSCLILMSADLIDQTHYAEILELEKRHCREGAYHDAWGIEIPKSIRDALMPYNLPSITRGAWR